MYSTKPLPEAISHRGLRTAAPENSIPAFLAAIDAGAEAIELDVHATADGTVFVHHDFDFVDESGTRSAFSTSDSPHVAKARLAGDVRIPRLDDVLEAVGKRAHVYVEIKPRGIEQDVARCLKRHFDAYDGYSVHSFDHRIVKKMLALTPSVGIGILQVGYPIDSREAMRAAGASYLWQHADFVDARLVADVHAYGGKIVVWTANTDSQWDALASAGVDGICTDNVDAYIAWRNSAG